MAPTKQRAIVSAHLQELAILMLAGTSIKGAIKTGIDQSRGRILADLKPEERELYLASRDVIMEFGRQLGSCQDLDTLAKVLQIVQGITTGNVYEYEEVKDRILD